MRRIGFLNNPVDANRFCEFLLTRQIRATAEQEAEGTDRQAIWVKEESRVDEARGLLADFQVDPRGTRYDVTQEAREILRREQAEQAQRLSRLKKFNPAAAGPIGNRGSLGNQRVPVTVVSIVLCVLAGLLTGFGLPSVRVDPMGREFPTSESRIYDAMTFVNRHDLSPLQRAEDDPFVSIRKGEIWRFLTPALLHGNMAHLVMNMMGLFFLGSVFERLHGGRWLAFALVTMAVVSMTVQVFWPAANNGGPSAVGASGAVYGLFGFFMIREFREPMYPIQLPPMFRVMGLGFLILGVLMVIPNIANGSHVGGLASGMLFAVTVPAIGSGRRG